MLLFSLLVEFACSNKKTPIILIPGFFDSQIMVSYDSTKFPIENRPKYCPSKANNSWEFFNVLHLIPPYLFCTANLLKLHFNDTTNEIVDTKNVNVSVIDFGGIDAINKLVRLPGGFHIIDLYGEYIRELISQRGYIVKRNLFGAPYDWRLGAAQRDSHYDKMKNLIEHAYNTNDGEKVAIVAHSQGTIVLTSFLERMTSEWRQKYVKRVALLAPCFAGYGMAQLYVWLAGVPDMPWFKSKVLGDFIRSAPGFSTLFPNQAIYGNTTIFYDTNGNPVSSLDLPDFFIKAGLFEGENAKIFNYSLHFLRRVPKELDVETLIYYNSNLPTLNSINYTQPNSLSKEIIYVPGDGNVASIGTEYVCKKWAHLPNIKCIDTKDGTHHTDFLTKPSYANKILNWAFNEDPNPLFDEPRT